MQQDLALVNLLGLTHVERNGHHYVNGMAGLPEHEQDAFLAAHPDLYEHNRGAVRLKILLQSLCNRHPRPQSKRPLMCLSHRL